MCENEDEVRRVALSINFAKISVETRARARAQFYAQRETCLLRFRVAETQVLLRAFESALARNGKESFWVNLTIEYYIYDYW